jgi:(p)ppGpp synthase/HD superfamily hydrolase
MKTLLDNILQFATEAHKGQTRWKKEIPYITHPIAVADLAVEFAKNSKFNWAFEEIDYAIIKIVSYWHDGAEDLEQYKDREDLIVENIEKLDVNKILNDRQLQDIYTSLHILNKHYYDSYLDFVLAAKVSTYAKFVKMGDITHNLSDLNQYNKKGSMKDKYELALYILKND